MTKSADTRKQQRNDFEARMHPPLTAYQKRLVAQFEKLLTESRSPNPWNAAITRCINLTKGV